MWVRLRLYQIGFQRLVRSGEKLSNDPMSHARYLQGALCVFGLSNTLLPIIGTPWYNYFLRYLLGLDVHPKAMIHAALMIEVHLWKIGHALLDHGAMVVPHYMKQGHYHFHRVTVSDGAWIGANCRILVPKLIESQCRVLPGTFILPRERILSETLWSGIPGAPVTTFRTREHVSRIRRRSSMRISREIKNHDSSRDISR